METKTSNERMTTVPSLPWNLEGAKAAIKVLESSGLSVKRFAQEHSIPEHRIYYWRAKMASPKEYKIPKMVQARLSGSLVSSSEQGTGQVEVKTPQGYTIRFGNDVGTHRLTEILAVCGSAMC